MNRSQQAAATRAAPAALTRPQGSYDEFDRYLLIDDTDEDASEIRTLMRERAPRGSEVQL